MELTFPTAALIVLHFVFVARRVLITHPVLATAQQCSQHHGCLSSLKGWLLSRARRLGVGKRLGGDTADPN